MLQGGELPAIDHLVSRGTGVAPSWHMYRPEFPRLSLISPNSIYPFERPIPKEKTEPVMESHCSEISHPFPVLHLDRGRYVLLDNLREFLSYRQLRLREVPVQICAAEELDVQVNKVALIDFHERDLVTLVHMSPELTLIEDNEEIMAEGFMRLVFRFSDQSKRGLLVRRTNTSGFPIPLYSLFLSIVNTRTHVAIEQRPFETESKLLRQVSPTCVIEPPDFVLKDLINAVTSGLLFPFNLVTVQIRRRVFCIDFPVSILRSSRSLEDKEAFLHDLIALRETSSKTSRFCGEVFFLNR